MLKRYSQCALRDEAPVDIKKLKFSYHILISRCDKMSLQFVESRLKTYPLKISLGVSVLQRKKH